MAVVYSKVLLFDPPLIYTAPDTCVFGAVIHEMAYSLFGKKKVLKRAHLKTLLLSLCLVRTSSPIPT